MDVPVSEGGLVRRPSRHVSDWSRWSRPQCRTSRGLRRHSRGQKGVALMTSTKSIESTELIARIEDLRPWLREHQAEAEQQRRIPQETIERLDAAGVFRVAIPNRY